VNSARASALAAPPSSSVKCAISLAVAAAISVRVGSTIVCPGAGQHHDRHIGVGGRVPQRDRGCAVELLVERVEDVRPVEGEGAHPVVVAYLQAHGSSVCANRKSVVIGSPYGEGG
jgi:hypothetical protein